MYDLIIKNGKLVTPDRVYETDIAVKDGKYAAFLAPGTEAEATEVIDAEGNLVYPGIIDCHAHLNEPGFDSHALPPLTDCNCNGCSLFIFKS